MKRKGEKENYIVYLLLKMSNSYKKEEKCSRRRRKVRFLIGSIVVRACLYACVCVHTYNYDLLLI
jgi:hypothetical protein